MRPKTNSHPIYNGSKCPYCGCLTNYVDSSCIYGKSYGMIYLCRPCNAYVGVHRGTNIALGRLANAELRGLKKDTHAFFDLIWKNGDMKRVEAYKWLSEYLRIPLDFTHIGMFDEERCRAAIVASKQFLNDMRRLDLDFGAEPKTQYFEI